MKTKFVIFIIALSVLLLVNISTQQPVETKAAVTYIWATATGTLHTPFVTPRPTITRRPTRTPFQPYNTSAVGQPPLPANTPAHH